MSWLRLNHIQAIGGVLDLSSRCGMHGVTFRYLELRLREIAGVFDSGPARSLACV